MSGGYILAEYSKIKSQFPEFQSVLNALRVSLLNKAMQDWDPKTNGGMKPTGGQFGIGTIMPELFNDISGTTMTTWDQYLTPAGAQSIIMTGSQTGGSIYEDYKVGIAGLAFLDKVQRVTEIKMQISDKKLPRINIEEAMAYKNPCLIFEDNYILDEETGFTLYAYVASRGWQKIKLIGLQVNRVPNKLQETAVGAALT